MPTPSFHIATLGCKVNQYESEALRQAWLAAGATESPDPAGASVILINTCAVTARAVSDVRQLVRRLRRASPGARIMLTGCAIQLSGPEYTSIADLPGIERIVPQPEKHTLLSLFSPANVPLAAPPAFPPFAISNFARARPILKVQDGCSHRCAFCVVPIARGKPASRPFKNTAEELQRLLDAGFREIVLAGVNLRQFGPDLPASPESPAAPDFWDLLDYLNERFAPEWAGRARLRLSSLDPGQFTEKALNTLARNRLLCPHLHLSLQSGSPETLRRMGRGHYSPGILLPFLERLAAAWPTLALGADLLVGFPGETDTHFAHTLDLVRALPMTYGHVFPYSRRPNTPAATLPGQISKEVRADRSSRLRAELAAKNTAFIDRLLALPHLTLAPENATSHGLCEFYIPCALSGQATPTRELIRATPVGLRNGRITLEAAP